jgi:16S rRNA (adenine1518-N6/adenine1519-N6)-dimethyltransferase
LAQAAAPGALTLVFGDALKTDAGPDPAHVVANLPYNVGTALLVKWLTAETWPPFWSSLTLMFQREVAERIVAKPDTEHYGRLSVLSQWRTMAKIQFDVSRNAFVPPPKITSSIVRLEPLAKPVAPANLADLERVTQAAFGQRRKMLRQSLKVLAPNAEEIVRAAGLDPTARAENLSVADFAALARTVAAPR